MSVFVPHYGLTNYRPQLSRPIQGRVRVFNRPGRTYRPVQTYSFTPHQRIQEHVMSYLPPRQRYKKRPKQTYRKRCCRYIRGRKVCRPEFCSKKKYWY